MKIAIWLYRLGGGGAERVIVDLAASFERAGHDVSLLVHTNDNPYAVALGGGVRLVSLENALSRRLRPRTLFCLWGLIAFLKKEKPDIVFTTGAAHSVILLLARALLRIDTRVVIRETNTIGAQAGKNAGIIENVMFFLARRLYPLADRIVAPSSGILKDMEERIPEVRGKACVIYNPIDATEIRKQAEQPMEDENLSGVPFILGVGRLVPQKGFYTLIRACAPLCRERGIHLALLGEGPERENLAALAGDLGMAQYLHMPGFVVNPFAFMARARLFVLSSRFEGLPNALLQAIAAGCPVVATDCPSGPDEILDGGKLAPLVPVDDVEALRRAIANALEQGRPADYALWDRIGHAYDRERITARYLDVFRSALAEAGR